MTGYSHSYHSIKLIHCGAPQRDVLSDNGVLSGDSQFLFHALPVLFIKYCYKFSIQRQMVVTHIFYFMPCQPSLLSAAKSFVYKDKLWFDESMSVIFCMENAWKKYFYSLSTWILHWIKLENFVMQLKRQSVEAWQNEKHCSKGNNTSENRIRRQEISNQSTMWSTKVRSGHSICCLYSFLTQLSSCRVTYENCHKSSGFFNLVWGEWMNLRNSNGFELRNFYFTTV